MNRKSLMEDPSFGPGLTRRESLATLAFTFGSLALGAKPAIAASSDGVAYSAATIHQEPVFSATPTRVYDALTDPMQFQKVQLLSAASKSLNLVSKPAEIGREPGGAILLFGGYISGWQLELEPERRIVEAWRAASWPPHIYSIAKFELIAQGTGAKIVFDHTGFPVNQAEHLAGGWKSNYWDALAQYFK
ncbi:MAG TPA: SRPBCC domain-containing protein [Terracidiphilus sp.]|nr:SRPBCC domain-containing protein [Terracidiphilus sp.]